MARDPRPIRLRPLWVRVDQNRLRLALFVVVYVTVSALLLTSAFVAVPGSLIGLLLVEDPSSGYWQSFLIFWLVAYCAVLAVGAIFSAVQLSNAEEWVRGRLEVQDLKRGEARSLVSAVGDMALAAGLSEPPRVALIKAGGGAINAFVLGTTRNRPLIGVTRRFLSALTVDEQRAVVSVLIARVVAGDIMFATALAALMGPLKAIRESARAAWNWKGPGGAGKTGDPGGQEKKSSGGQGGGGCGCGDGCSDIDLGDRAGYVILVIIVIVVLTYVAVLTASWIVTLWGMVLQRTAHEKADAEGLLLLKDPAPMLSAFRKTATSWNQIAGCDFSYDGIFYTATSGTPRIERVEKRRYRRLREVVGVEGLAAEELEEVPLTAEEWAMQQLGYPEPPGEPQERFAPAEPMEPEDPPPPDWAQEPEGPWEPFGEGGGGRTRRPRSRS